MFTLSYHLNLFIQKFLFKTRLYFINPGLIRGLSRLSSLINCNFNYRIKFLDESVDVIPATIKHNLLSLRSTTLRMNALIKPLKAIELVNDKSKILVIGPRSEWDLFLLGGEGFQNVNGIDLISYSSRINLGDMHKISDKIAKNSYDVILCGWTLSYSSNPQKVAKEISSIIKDGGIIGIAVEYAIDDPALDEKWKNRDGYSLVDRSKLYNRINSVKQILDLFCDNEINVFFQHDAPMKKAHHPDTPLLENPSTVAVIFQLLK